VAKHGPDHLLLLDFFLAIARNLHCHYKKFCDIPAFTINLAAMDFFTNVFSWIGLLAPPPPRLNALEFSTLSNLPTEIILQISRLLPPESAACFSICCRPIYFALETQYLEDLRPMEGFPGLHRERLLKLLEGDLPDHIICGFCKKLHSINRARRHLHSNGDYFNHLKCWKVDYESMAGLYVHGEFSSSVFEMTMKRYRQGSEYSDLLDLLSLKPTTRSRIGYVEQRTAAAKLIDGSLIVREQKIFKILATQPVPFPWDASFVICPHISFFTIEHLNRYLRDIRVSDWKIHKGHLNRERIVRCRYCRSEYQIEFKQFGRRGNAMYVTKWLDLGQGPLEYNCRSHLHNAGGLPERQIEFDSGYICAAFEGRGQFDFDTDADINSKDRKELFKKSLFSWPESRLFVAPSELPN
jgi:hypothetical protein